MLGDLLAQVPTAAPSGVQKTRPERSGKNAMQASASRAFAGPVEPQGISVVAARVPCSFAVALFG